MLNYTKNFLVALCLMMTLGAVSASAQITQNFRLNYDYNGALQRGQLVEIYFGGPSFDRLTDTVGVRDFCSTDTSALAGVRVYGGGSLLPIVFAAPNSVVVRLPADAPSYLPSSVYDKWNRYYPGQFYPIYDAYFISTEGLDSEEVDYSTYYYVVGQPYAVCSFDCGIYPEYLPNPDFFGGAIPVSTRAEGQWDVARKVRFESALRGPQISNPAGNIRIRATSLTNPFHTATAPISNTQQVSCDLLKYEVNLYNLFWGFSSSHSLRRTEGTIENFFYIVERKVGNNWVEEGPRRIIKIYFGDDPTTVIEP